MPPKQGSDLRPDIARRELTALYERYAPAKLDDPGYLDGLLSKYCVLDRQLSEMTPKYDGLLSRKCEFISDISAWDSWWASCGNAVFFFSAGAWDLD